MHTSFSNNKIKIYNRLKLPKSSFLKKKKNYLKVANDMHVELQDFQTNSKFFRM